MLKTGVLQKLNFTEVARVKQRKFQSLCSLVEVLISRPVCWYWYFWHSHKRKASY